MRKQFILFATAAMIFAGGCSDEYDDSVLNGRVDKLENRVVKLEELCKQMNTNIVSLQTLVTALQNNDFVTGVTPLSENGVEIGYTITFSKSAPITIYHGQNGKDGVDGKDGHTPVIGVRQDTDGIYYWTLDGEWLLDSEGNKIQAEGRDGQDGADGQPGANGQDGITPLLKIEDGYWFVSTDGGATWTSLGKATGENGQDGTNGADGKDGDSFFQNVDTSNTEYIIFTLADGTQIKLPTWSAFEALQRLCNETNTNLTALQTIVTALQNNDYITSVDPLTENGQIIGYTIKFAKSNPIVIYNGKDGADGNTPVIGVKQDTDGFYYWTLDGEFILVDGQKIKAQGTDGSNGSDGVTPKLEIREGYWWISYDNGTNWTQLGKATGENGKDAESITITQDENNVYFELADGTVITISKTGESIDSNVIQFEDENVKKLCVAVWDTDGDHELSYEEAAAVTALGTTFKENTVIQLFNELKYFTGLTALDDTFNGCSNLWRVTIPINVEVIGTTSFNGCSQLKRVAFDKGSNLKIIPAKLFANLSSLTTIEIPASVEIIEESAFAYCQSLLSITFEQGSHLRAIKGSAFVNDKRQGSGAFYCCTALKSIDIPASIEVIESTAFYCCTSLASVTFGKGAKLTAISGGSVSNHSFGTFYGCAALTSIEIPANVEIIESSAFQGCTSLARVSFEKGSRLQIIDGRDHGAFAQCSALTSFEIPATVKIIGGEIFADCNNLMDIYCMPINPPQISPVTIPAATRFYVPIESVDAYKAATYWEDHANQIVGYNFTE